MNVFFSLFTLSLLDAFPLVTDELIHTGSPDLLLWPPSCLENSLSQLEVLSAISYHGDLPLRRELSSPRSCSSEAAASQDRATRESKSCPLLQLRTTLKDSPSIRAAAGMSGPLCWLFQYSFSFCSPLPVYFPSGTVLKTLFNSLPALILIPQSLRKKHIYLTSSQVAQVMIK